MSAAVTTSLPDERTALKRLTSAIDWRRDIIYVGFVVVFLVFAVLLLVRQLATARVDLA
ncbi:hypothetical protein AGMMS50218_17850 [Actinomycetota bacterium]|nr:hypothetical protein AGMMS50218_17850 [Actinomycetota bacterium]